MPSEHSLIANSGIQFITFPVSINTQDRFNQWYHEWYDTTNGEWRLDPVYELRTDDECIYYNKQQLYKNGYLSDPTCEIDAGDLKNDGIMPLRIDDVNCEGVKGEIFNVTFSDRNNRFLSFENVWLPAPYFFKRKRFRFGPLNWARLKLLYKGTEKGIRHYDAILAFDTRTKEEDFDDYNECPVFPDKFRTDMDFMLCSNEFYLMDYCTADQNWSYIDEYLFHLVHPEVQRVSQIRGANVRRMDYVSSYVFLMSYLANQGTFPKVKLYKDKDVETRDVDMVVDIGNSRTTALLIEDNSNFNQVRQLSLVDFTDMIKETPDGIRINRHCEPFDMRLAFRKVDFGDFGIKDSKQFVYPSLVRLGVEANELIRLASNNYDDAESLSTYSSPKRYLWDGKPTREEWQFLVLPSEKDDHILNLRGITNQLRNDGSVDANGESGSSYHYSRRSLMTFAFLEMLVQARAQINSEEYRSIKFGFGKPEIPRRIRRIIVTCPTAMSKLEREALVKCAKDAVVLLENSGYANPSDNSRPGKSVEVIPSVNSRKDNDGGNWYYDEATCSQLVYMYGEVGNKYKGCSSEFFNLYGKIEDGVDQPSITIGSLDIGAGTSDLMVSKYTYIKGDITTITPSPLFYDSFYFAGDDLLYAMVKNLMLLDENSAFRQELHDLTFMEYRQKMKDFFGKDYNGQTVSDRILRKDFNIQYSVPLMCHFLELLKQGHKDCVVKYADVFDGCPPNESVLSEFKERIGIDVKSINWQFRKEDVAAIVRKGFEPLLKKVATIMYSHACDIVLLSGRPASLPVIRDLFLKYYAVSPNRLIVLNDYFVGDWYPFSENTGYIRNAKTIVAIGGVIGHYASELSNLNKFIINLDLMKKNLKSTVNYIEASREGQPIEYFITPEKNRGELMVSSIPETLNVRQIGMDSYPCRALYSIDFNRYKIADKIRRRAILEGGGCPTDAKVMAMVKDVIDGLKKKMPFKVTIERDAEDKESLSISSIIDKNGNEVTDGNLEIHIQSLGVDERYWLDTGAFNF